MTFLTVLLALFVERVLQQHRPQRRHRWFDSYCRRLTHAAFPQWLMTKPWGGIVALLPPLLLIAWLQAFFGDLGAAFELAFGVTVLLHSLGPRDLGDDTEAFITARDTRMNADADTQAEALSPGEVPTQEPQRSFAVAGAVVVPAARRLIAPIFWFVAFGAVGAAAYRAVALLAERLQHEACPREMPRYSDEMRHVADWAPARIIAGGSLVAALA